MSLTLTPPVPQLDLNALRQALTRAGVRVDAAPEAYASAWRRAAAREATLGESASPGYARSPRRTRGATRA
jgi:hypothetical protein